MGIGAGSEIPNRRRPLGDAADHGQPVADRLVAGHRNIAFDPAGGSDFNAVWRMPTHLGRLARTECRIDFIKSLMLLTVMPLKDPRSFELTVPSRLEEMTAVHALVDEALREYQLSEDLAHWIELTISESMINAIQHGNKCDPAKNATLRI